MTYVVLIVTVIASLPFVIWLVATLMHNKHLPAGRLEYWMTRSIADRRSTQSPS